MSRFDLELVGVFAIFVALWLGYGRTAKTLVVGVVLFGVFAAYFFWVRQRRR